MDLKFPTTVVALELVGSKSKTMNRKMKSQAGATNNINEHRLHSNCKLIQPLPAIQQENYFSEDPRS